MKERMISFLSSIGISDYESYDLDFEMVGWNRFDPKLLDMVIVKETPWDYELLRRFQDGLNNISYHYTMRFSYIFKPTPEDVISLFDDWHLSIYHFHHKLNVRKSNDETVEVVFKSEEEEAAQIEILKEFKAFLSWLSYDFVTFASVIEEEEEIIEVPEEIKIETVEKAAAIAENDIEENKDEVDPTDRNDIIKQIEEEQKEKTTILENSLLNEMKLNKKLMEKERERMRLNRRGNYNYCEKIDDISPEMGNVDFNGEIFSIDVNDKGKVGRVTLGISDSFGGAIKVWAYQTPGGISVEKTASLSIGTNVRVRGAANIDDYSKQLNVKVHNLDLLPPDEIEEEPYKQNRVELHLHSNMSTQDGVSSMEEYVNYAKALGHKAIAITDHGNVQGFPDAQKAAKSSGLKMLYGCELYMVDDEIKYIFNPQNIELNKAKYVVFDLETTGLSARYDRIIEFGAVKISGGTVVDRIDILINPKIHIPEKITSITNISDDLVKNEKTIREVLPTILDFIGDAILVTHNAQFDISFLNEALVNNGFEALKNGAIDTLALSRYSFPESRNHRLGTLCRRLEVKYDEDSAHRADYDAYVLSEVWLILLAQLTKHNLKMQHCELSSLGVKPELLTHLFPRHVIAFAKNLKGLKELYKLVSISHIDYLANVPLIPRRILQEHRQDLLLGSACLNGEVFETSRYYNRARLIETCSFYDYIEVQPPENYSFLVNMGEMSNEEVIRSINDIIEAGKAANKIVVATGDAHYAKKKQKVFRDVYISAPQVGNINHPLNPYNRSRVKPFDNPDQHYRSTSEMLEAFSFLDKSLAEEIVIKNTNIIADMIDNILPVPNDKLYTPKIDNVENMLKDLCFSRAHELYGDPLPEFIQNRLDTELNGIISNGYSVIYYIAHKLVKKSNDDGYIVGSRGSVGSSFVATMAGITEVNPLPPHYLCPKCHHLEWTKVDMPDIKSGFDLPKKKCPCCGEELLRDGQDIPFETFLGFHADKVPDIDLNFPGDYQAKAHDYTKVLLGKDNVYRAGTIETVAEKTAFGFARGYIERQYIAHGMSSEEAKEAVEKYPKIKIEYLASGCVGVKRTTGQHPGGIVVIPSDHDVYDFTPVQWPANEVNSAWKTTHFDFHSIHDTILKLDMLGHVDPVALKMMCDLTHMKIEDIPLSDPKVFELFSSNKPLGLKHNYLNEETGAMAIPEFGTDFVRGILEKTRPSTFSELVIISGLSHGTNVWNGNAEALINSKQATLREVIGCRDDIMVYLISKGLPAEVSFAIMEDVRKGRGLKTQYVEAMLAHNVPQYYIDSCNKIKYMFPKGHAVAYVTMAIRVGYFKVYHPLEFYATFFSVRSKQYDIIPMIKGEDAIINRLEQLKNLEKTTGKALSPKEEEQYKTLQIAIEMVERGYKFSNIDLYKSDATNFVVDHENKALIPPFITIDGLGENNAITVIEERKKRPFTSKEDLLKRTKLTSTNVNDLKDMGVLDSLPDTDQISLFDFGDF